MQIEGKDLNIDNLSRAHPTLTELSLHNVRTAYLPKLADLEKLPLHSLGLRWFAGADLTALSFPPNLQHLTIWHSSKLRSLKGLEAAKALETLVLRDNGPLEDLSALRDLPALKTLSIEGGYGEPQKISTLAQLDGLPLRSLQLRAVKGVALDLTPLTHLPDLNELDLHGPNFDPAELAKVAAAHPWFYDQLRDLKDYPLQGMRCKKCGGVQKEMFLRGKKFLWCPICSKSGLQKVLDAFDAQVTAARSQLT